MFVIPAEQLDEFDRDPFLQELGHTIYSYPERSCTIIAWEPSPQPPQVDHQHDVNKPPGVPALQSRTRDPLAARACGWQPLRLFVIRHIVSITPINIQKIISTTHKAAAPHNPSEGAEATTAVNNMCIWGPMEQDSESDTGAT
ncbi:hypothetical protein PENSUB_5627 [Penicillium subrubescens]|uniref:Uncharacterized protein n=1 Tax=Penicillium subrubescens TaxID=1316194 RepID=A0A1Q5U720_9EURO|nr:hypothetical protein PENSUB_5627 [Penicillium subrubescens]